jgi:hypothetical protein
VGCKMGHDLPCEGWILLWMYPVVEVPGSAGFRADMVLALYLHNGRLLVMAHELSHGTLKKINSRLDLIFPFQRQKTGQRHHCTSDTTHRSCPSTPDSRMIRGGTQEQDELLGLAPHPPCCSFANISSHCNGFIRGYQDSALIQRPVD